MRTLHSCLVLTSILLLSLCVVFSSSSPVAAVDVSPAVDFVKGVNRPYWQSSNNETKHQGSYNFGGASTYGSSNWVRLFDNDGSNLTVDGGHYVSITGVAIIYSSGQNLGSTNVNSQPLGTWGAGADVSNNDCNFIDLSYDDQVTLNTQGYYSYRYNFEWICRASGSGISNPVTNLWINGNSNIAASASLNIQRVTIWEPNAGFDDSAIISRINAVNTNISNLNTKLNTTNNKLDDLVSKAEDLADAQAQANQDAQDRYDQEKQEEADREASGQQSSDDLSNAFNFSVLNPFSPIFGMFSSSCSVNIPTIAYWLNSPSSTYTSWWCSSNKLQNIRSTLSTVFSLFTMMLIFGFVINWLRNDTSSVTVTYKDNP